MSSKSLSVQIETVTLIGQTTIALVEKLLSMFTDLTSEVAHLKSDNASLKSQISDLRDLFSSRSSHLDAAVGNLSSKSRVTSYKDALVSSLPHQLPRSTNTSKNPRNTPVSSCTPTAANAVAVASTVGIMLCRSAWVTKQHSKRWLHQCQRNNVVTLGQ